ncbi:porin [Chitinophagaceae bacterium LWZ2-11]
MNRIILFIIAVFACCRLSAQGKEKQIDTSINHTRRIIPIEKAELLKNIDMIANMQYGLLSDFNNGEYTDSKFSMNQFRLEIKGKVFDKVYFRFRDRYTRNTTPQSVDNISYSTDLAYIAVDVSPKVTIALGKMCAAWGGYEFDMNPIDIYAYNDIVEYADNFLSGAQVEWKAAKNHSFTFQLMNSRTQSFQQIYGTIPGIEESKFPAAIVGNWTGKFADGKFQTIWSYSIFTEAKKRQMYYTALGNQFHAKNLTIQYDFKLSREGLDRKGIVSSIVPKSYYPYAVDDAMYIEHWLRGEYFFTPKWSASLIGMVSDAYWTANPDPNKDNHLRTAWGIIPSVEFYPFKDFNLKFFASYVGRFYNYSDYSKTKFGSVNSTTGQFTIGFISPLVIL